MIIYLLLNDIFVFLVYYQPTISTLRIHNAYVQTSRCLNTVQSFVTFKNLKPGQNMNEICHNLFSHGLQLYTFIQAILISAYYQNPYQCALSQQGIWASISCIGKHIVTSYTVYFMLYENGLIWFYQSNLKVGKSLDKFRLYSERSAAQWQDMNLESQG